VPRLPLHRHRHEDSKPSFRCGAIQGYSTSLLRLLLRSTIERLPRRRWHAHMQQRWRPPSRWTRTQIRCLRLSKAPRTLPSCHELRQVSRGRSGWWEEWDQVLWARFIGERTAECLGISLVFF
jgi:hypothetical protein